MPQRLITALVLVIVLLAAAVQAGCWDLRQAEDLGYVMATAVDRTPQGLVKLLVQVPNPRALAAGPRGGVTPGASISSKAFRNYEVVGRTIFDAIRAAAHQSPKRLFFAQNRTVIFSEDLARQGLGDVLDFFGRSVEIRRRLNRVFVAKGDVRKILNVPNPHGVCPALRIDNIVRWRGQTSHFAAVPLSKVLETLSLDGQEPFVGVIEAVANPTATPRVRKDLSMEPPLTITLTGAALFRQDRLVGFLNEPETRGLLWVLNEVRGGQLVVPGPGGKGQIAADIHGGQATIKPELTDGRIRMTVEISVVGDVAEAEGPFDLSKPEVAKEIDRLCAAAVRREVLAAVAKAQEVQSDVFGFGEAFRRRFPQEWKTIKDDWPEIFPGVEVLVKVDAEMIHHIGMISKSRAISVP
ncbi:MAG: Ger(x)C family spore germination protein [Peptococcaceae bacterium]|nr:Ger(x)C family spore germination protein [Peptococcaceae bacterium]